jgi:hypothetical protein
MEQARLIDSALKLIFFDNDVENGRHPENIPEHLCLQGP